MYFSILVIVKISFDMWNAILRHTVEIYFEYL